MQPESRALPILCEAEDGEVPPRTAHPGPAPPRLCRLRPRHAPSATPPAGAASRLCYLCHALPSPTKPL